MKTEINCTNNTVTVTCGGESPCKSKQDMVIEQIAEKNKVRATRRPITDHLIGEWTKHWHNGQTATWIASEYGYSVPTICYNMYKHIMFAQAARIEELEQQIKQLRLQNKQLRDKNKGFNKQAF